MATIAAILDRLAIARGVDEAAQRLRSRGEDPFTIRAIANEDVFFFSKRIDNSQVVRQADPQAWGIGWRMIGGSMAVAIVLVAVMLPALNTSFSGYKIESLRQERARLLTERTELELQEARILSPQHLQELAREQSFVDPEPGKIVYLEPNSELIMANRVTLAEGLTGDQAR